MNDLTPRQAEILAAVTQRYIERGRPVGSKYLSDSHGFELAPSTLRSELAGLERMGYLDQPHTSAGRMPTDKGYRYYVDNIVTGERRAAGTFLELDGLDGEIEVALRGAATVLARATGLLAMVTMPVQGHDAIMHIEVLRLNPDLVMVVVITASGGVYKQLFVFESQVDTGLVKWARSFLNDAIGGMDLGSRLLRIRLEEFELAEVERGFIEAISPAFIGTRGRGEQMLFIEGTSGLLDRLQRVDGFSARRVIELLDRQEAILDLLRQPLAEFKVCLRIGSEIPAIEIQHCSLVAAGYGIAHRNLGAVGVLGPTRMDYPSVIGSVEDTARSLSEFIGDIY